MTSSRDAGMSANAHGVTLRKVSRMNRLYASLGRKPHGSTAPWTRALTTYTESSPTADGSEGEGNFNEHFGRSTCPWTSLLTESAVTPVKSSHCFPSQPQLSKELRKLIGDDVPRLATALRA
jgi:hypothetical protein